MTPFIDMSDGKFWILASITVVATLAGFYFAFRNLSRARIIEDTPTAKIRSAHQGYAELAGTAALMDGTPIIAPLTGSHCCWYHYRIQQRCHKNNWRTVEKGSSESLFLLQDETGDCIIDPEGAEVCPTDRSIWYGNSREPGNRNPSRTRLDNGRGFKMHTGIVRGNYRYTEERIYPDDTLYAIGLFKSLDEVDHQRNRSAMTRDLLRDWKLDTANLLARFDVNKDGKIDIEEWDQARATAIAQTKQKHAEQLKKRVLHTLSKTASSRRPYLLSSLPQFNLVRRYRLLAGGSIAGFFIAGTMAAWMLTSRLMT